MFFFRISEEKLFSHLITIFLLSRYVMDVFNGISLLLKRS